MKTNRIILSIAGIAVVLGLIISGTATALLMNESSKNTMSMQTQVIAEPISAIDIYADKSDIDINIIPSNTGEMTLTYFSDDLNQYDILTNDNTLSVKSASRFKDRDLKWYDDFMRFDFKKNYDITLQVPKTLYENITLYTSCGDIKVENLNANNMNVKSNFGDIEVSNCEISAMETASDAGDINFKDCIGGIADFDNNCGDIEILRCKFSSLKCVLDFGDIDIDFSGGEIIDCDVNCGDINLNSVWGNNITLLNDCGDIEGSIAGDENEYSIDAETSFGSNNLKSRAGGENILNVKTDFGDIDIEFVKWRLEN